RRERTRDRQRLDVRAAGRVVCAGVAAVERAKPIRAGADLADERGRDAARPGLDGDANAPTRVDRAGPLGDSLACSLRSLAAAADLLGPDASPVDCDLKDTRML